MRYEYQFIKVTGPPGRILTIDVPDEKDGWELKKETIRFYMGVPTVMQTWRRSVGSFYVDSDVFDQMVGDRR